MSIPSVHPHGFDPTYGMSLDDLEAMRPPAAPPGFDAFWQARYERVRAIDPKPRLGPARVSADGAWVVHDLTYTSTDAFPIGGWLLRPATGEITRGLVVGHGYGGRDGPDFDLPVESTAILFPCFRGLGRSARAPISTDPAWHVLHNIDNPDRYILGGCVEDLWLAVSSLLALHPETAGRIGYSGISFGGGIGALAIPYDPRIARGQLEVPTFGNMPLWQSLPTVGSANAVQNFLRAHPEIRANLSVFDSAVAASRIAVPMLFAVARFDPAVAPPCQFSVANASAGHDRFHETFVLDAGHFDYDGMAAQHVQLAARVRQFFGAT